MSDLDAIAGTVVGERKDWTPSRLIAVFCQPGMSSGFHESGRKNGTRSDWRAGFCAYLETNAYGEGIDGFDDGHALWGELIQSGWSLIQDPGDRQFPYAFYMEWRPREDATPGTPDGQWCMVNYCEGDFGVEIYDDEAACRAGEQTVRAL
jgi:hypothetical protein